MVAEEITEELKESKVNTNSIRVFQDRNRTNFFRKLEQRIILSLVEKIPSYISSDSLTIIGIAGSVVVLISFVLGAYTNPVYLLVGVIGLGINWFGDSLDGRLAYYRNTPRKWYGFALDIIVDWIGTIFIGFGYFIYAGGNYEILAFLFVALYGWAMIISQLRYKITGIYTIDSGLAGPTELRIIISFILVLEVLFRGSINLWAAIITLILFIINVIDSIKLFREGDLRDKQEKVFNSNES